MHIIYSVKGWNIKDNMMNKEDFIMRKLTVSDADQYNTLLRYAFQVTDQELFECGWEDEDIKQSKFPVLERANVWGYFDEDELVSQFAAYPLQMNIHSKIEPVAFVTSVSTYPEYTGMGLMSDLMKRSLTEMRENKQSFALLYPYSIPLYRNKGWEIVSDKMTYKIPNNQLPTKIKESRGYVERVSWDNVDFMNLHTTFAKETHGCLFRNKLAWDEYWRWDEDDTIVAVYYKENDQPGGYMVYRIKENVMYVKEMIYIDQESRRGLWKYISAHYSMVHEVRGANYFNHPIAFMLEDSAIKETIRPYIMGRIIDVEMFFEDYMFNHDIEADITIEVADEFLEWNNKTFNIHISDEHGTFTDKKSEYYARMDIATLTTMSLGYKRASQLATIERIEADKKTIRLLDKVFTYDKPYISDYI